MERLQKENQLKKKHITKERKKAVTTATKLVLSMHGMDKIHSERNTQIYMQEHWRMN